jgi:hypothetical protein
MGRTVIEPDLQMARLVLAQEGKQHAIGTPIRLRF